jgi:hypothetical protein
MSDETDIRLWSTLIGWAVMIFGGGAAYGHIKHKTDAHQKAIDNCKMEDLMTEDKCREFHGTHQEATDVTLTNIQRTLDDIRQDRKDSETRLGAMAGRIEVIFDRWERQNG